MNVVRLFQSKKDFAEFVKRHLLEITADIALHEDEADPLHLSLEMDGEPCGELNLHNMWEAYDREGDLNCVIHGLNSQLKALTIASAMTSNMTTLAPREILPALSSSRIVSYRQENDVKVIHHEIVPMLSTVYKIARPPVSVLVTEDLLKTYQLTPQKLKQLAVHNLKNAGWVYPREIYQKSFLKYKAEIQFYEHHERPFEMQLFVQEMAREHLPNSYLVAVPNRGFAAVLVVECRLSTVEQAIEAAWETGFAPFVLSCYRYDPNPLAPNLYLMKGKHCHPLRRQERNHRAV